MIPLPSQPVLAPIELSAYRHLEEQGISTVLQMSGLTVELKAIDNSRRQLVMSVGISLIRTADGNVLRELMVIGERLITDDQGAMSLATWAEHDAATFRAEIDQALHRLAEQIVEELAVDRTLLSVQADSSIRIEDLPKPVQNVMDTIRNVGNRVGDEIPKATSAVIGAINKVVKSDPVSKDQL